MSQAARLRTWTIETEAGQREWQADDVDHALEQHRDAHPNEPVIGAWLGSKRDETLADEWTGHGEPLPGTPGTGEPQDTPPAASSPQQAAGDTDHAGTGRLTGLAESPGTFEVEVTRSITATVGVQALSAQAAWSKVTDRDYPLPPRDEWTGSKDWQIVVYDPAGRELGRDDGDGYYDTSEPRPGPAPGGG